MFGQFKRHMADPSGESARAVLDALADSVGRSGLAALAGRPALVARVDQHAAAVREALTGVTGAVPFPTGTPSSSADPFRQPGPVPLTVLTAYAEGVRDCARAHGWTPPAGPVDWSTSDWVLLRLLAVYWLAREPAFPAPSPGRGAPGPR